MKLTMPWRTEAANQPRGFMDTLDGARRALGNEAEHLAQVAAQVGRDATEQAGKTGSDVGATAASVARDTGAAATTLAATMLRGAGQLGSELAKSGSELARSGRKGAAHIGQDVQTIGQDLRKVRVTTEPRKSGPDMLAGVTLLGGFGAGIALMYFMDAEQGPRRRALLRDRLTRWTSIGRETATERAKELRHMTSGVMADARQAVSQRIGDADSGVTEAETTTYESSAHASGNGHGHSEGKLDSEQTSDEESHATVN